MFIEIIKSQQKLLLLSFLSLLQVLFSGGVLSEQKQERIDLSLYELSQLTVRSINFYDQSLQQATLGSSVILDSQTINHSSATQLAGFLQFQVPSFYVGASEQSYSYSHSVNAVKNTNTSSNVSLIFHDRNSWVVFPEHQVKVTFLYKFFPDWNININSDIPSVSFVN